MSLQSKYGLKNVINARGTFTPLGVSRSSDHVADITAQALKCYFDMEELQAAAGEIIARHCNAQSATITNCASAGITLSIAAILTGKDANKIARLPDTNAMNNKVVIATSHNVNYGHPIEQDIRLTGCIPVYAGTKVTCTIDDLAFALDQPGVAALLYVESRLATGEFPQLQEVVALANSKKIPIIVDGAAQDMRMEELVASGADLLVFSAQKYLAGPTAGIVVGKRQHVEAVHAQMRGIGRPMKAGKETILGTIAAIEDRQHMDMERWSAIKRQEATVFSDALAALDYITAKLIKDPSKGDFWRIDMTIDETNAKITATDIAQELLQGDPVIYCNSARAEEGILNFEILELDHKEHQIIVEQITRLLLQAKNTHRKN